MSKVSDCLKCQLRRPGFACFYEYTMPDGQTYVWDVELAQRIVLERCKKAVAMGQTVDSGIFPGDYAQKLLAEGSVDLEHVGHVNSAWPGLAVFLPWQGQDNWVLIDGNHRAVRAYQLGLEFTAIILTPEEDRRCRIEGSQLDRLAMARALSIAMGLGE